MKYVIIGNGVAGINAANRIRSKDTAADITVISHESDHFFSRTALMYVVCGQMSARDIEPYERDHYQRMNFKRVRDEVLGLDAKTKKLRMRAGQEISYDRLLIAAGSVPRMVGWPGEELDGVCNFVTWQNLELLQEKAKIAKKACVVGGGLIGIEAVEVLLMAGIEVSFVIRESHYWPIALNENESALITEEMKRHGCDVRLNTETKAVLGESGKVSGLLTGSGETIACDMVVFAVGVRPQTDWLKDSGVGLDKSGGIVVDDFLRTNLQDVYAAGDCTSVVWFNGVRRPEQLWYTSRDQGRVAGQNMSGEERVYKRATFYNSAKFFDVEYTTAGYVNFNFDGEQNWYQHEPGTMCTERITYLPDRTVIGFNMIGRRWDHRVMVRWVDEKRTVDYVLDHLHEAIFDEEFMPKFKVLTAAAG